MIFIKYLNTSLKGFAVFFSIIVVLKFSSFFFGFSKTANFEVMDIYQSFIGSVLFILSSFSKKFVKNI